MKKLINSQEKRNYQDSPIRKCTADCYFFKHGGKGCQYFVNSRVRHTETCLFDLMKLKQYADAMVSGDNAVVKNDAARINASIVLLIQRMLEQVNIEGVSVSEPIVDAKGNPIYIPDQNWRPNHGQTEKDRPVIVALRIKDHPLISRAIQLAKSIGITLSEFKLTPKSADEKAKVSGHIIVDEQKPLDVVMNERREIEEKMLKALEEGDRRMQVDPVYQDLLNRGDIIQ